MAHNSLPVVYSLLDQLAQAQIRVWLFGGWAEEVWGLVAPRPHADIDLLYPAAQFAALDAWIARSTHLRPIPTKRFSHKRAVLLDDLMIEWLRVETHDGCLVTHFWNGRHTMTWPAGTLTSLHPAGLPRIDVASPAALQSYRQDHVARAQAYAGYLRAQPSMA